MNNQGKNQMSSIRSPRGMMKGPVVKPKNAKKTLYRIWSYMGKRKPPLAAAIILVIVTSLLNLLGPYLIGVIIDEHIIPKDISGTIRMSLILAGIYITTSLLTWLQTYLMVNVSFTTIGMLRQDLFAKLQTLSLRFFDKRAHGELMSRVTNDIDNLNSALSQSVIQALSSILSLVGITIAMFSLNWILAIITLIVIPLMVIIVRQILKRSSENFVKRQKDLGELNGFVEEAISGGEVVTLFSKEKDFLTVFNERNEQLRSSATKAETFSGFLGPVTNFINNLGLALVIGAGAFMAVQGSVTVGMIASFVNYSRQFSRPISQMANLVNTILSAIAGAERVFAIMDEQPDVTNKPNALSVTKFAGDVAFENVSFGYNDEKMILKNVTLTAKKGEMVALVGPTGSGKTTIINLLTRFYDISNGDIKIDGRSISDYNIHDLRNRIGIVLQDTYLFSGTIADNIRFGRLDASDEEVKSAAKMANAHSFIKHLPQQYNTVISAGGGNLSEGQKQLLSIARAMLSDCDILILDEATSNIDTKTEIDIQRGMSNLLKGKTSFVIAHRLKTIENADQILVLKDGQIIEEGNHRELLDKQGFYHKLYTQQFTI